MEFLKKIQPRGWCHIIPLIILTGFFVYECSTKDWAPAFLWGILTLLWSCYVTIVRSKRLMSVWKQVPIVILSIPFFAVSWIEMTKLNWLSAMFFVFCGLGLLFFAVKEFSEN